MRAGRRVEGEASIGPGLATCAVWSTAPERSLTNDCLAFFTRMGISDTLQGAARVVWPVRGRCGVVSEMGVTRLFWRVKSEKDEELVNGSIVGIFGGSIYLYKREWGDRDGTRGRGGRGLYKRREGVVDR